MALAEMSVEAVAENLVAVAENPVVLVAGDSGRGQIVVMGIEKD